MMDPSLVQVGDNAGMLAPPVPDMKAFENVLTQMGLDRVMPEVVHIRGMLITIQDKQTSPENSLKFTQDDYQETKQTVGALQARSMKNNLVFHNIPERRNDNTKQVLVDFVIKSLKMDPSSLRTYVNSDDICEEQPVVIARCHRFGPFTGHGSSRPLVAVFIRGKDDVLRNAKNLAQTNYFVSTQLPPEATERKDRCYQPFMTLKSREEIPNSLDKGTLSWWMDKSINPAQSPSAR